MDPYDVVRRPAEAPDAVMRYADHADGLIDLYLPPGLGRPSVPYPLVVVVHGGFWRQEWDRTHARPLAGDLARRGYVVALPEYRRTGGLGGWPATGRDVATALDRMRTLVDGVAPGWVDPDAPLTLTGHSAGGHLALWAGLRAGAATVARIVALAPVSDLVEAARRDLDGGAAQDLLGGGPDAVPDRYTDADPLAGLTSASPGVAIVHGDDDPVVPVEMSRTAAAEHPAIGYVELAGVEHFALIDPLSTSYVQTVLPSLGVHRSGPA